MLPYISVVLSIKHLNMNDIDAFEPTEEYLIKFDDTATYFEKALRKLFFIAYI